MVMKLSTLSPYLPPAYFLEPPAQKRSVINKDVARTAFPKVSGIWGRVPDQKPVPNSEIAGMVSSGQLINVSGGRPVW